MRRPGERAVNKLFIGSLLVFTLLACDRPFLNDLPEAKSPHSEYCGDGVINGDEDCDEGALNSDDWSLEAQCLSDCSGFAPHCGDGS